MGLPSTRLFPGTTLRVDIEEACRRLDEALRAATVGGEDASIVFVGLYGVLQSREEVVDWVLTIETELLGEPRASRGPVVVTSAPS